MRRLAILLMAAVVAAPVAGFAEQASQSDAKDGVYDELNLFDEAFERIRQDSVDSVSDQKLIGAAITGMLTGLDPRAAYIDAAALKAMNQPAAGGEVGIGAVLTMNKGELKVISPRDGSPAAAAGIKPGDLILAIDNQPTYELSLSDAEQRLRGPAGTTVLLALQRGNESAPLKLSVKRAAEHLRTVSARVENGDLGYVRIAGFDDGTAAELAAAVQGLRQQAPGKLSGVVLDLRNNPGGKFEAAVKVANAFLDKGDVALLSGHNPADPPKHIGSTPNDLLKGLPIVVLVNGGTAEEAEMLAGALQDNHRALLIGTKTFGESAIETLIPLAEGGAIRLTTARFATPGGHEIDGHGIAPDMVLTPLKLEKFAREEGLHEADLPGALKNPDQPAATAPAQTAPGGKAAPVGAPPGAMATPPKAPPSVASGEIGGPNDEQLTQALDVLRGLAVFNRRAAG